MEAIKAKPMTPAAPGDRSAQSGTNPILARLLQLAVSALQAENPIKSANIIVNRIHTLVRTDRAVMVPMKGSKRILCISGNLEVSQDNPFSQAVYEIRKAFRDEKEPKVITPETLPEEIYAPNARKVMEAVGGTSILWIPLILAGKEESGYGLWLERWQGRPWLPEEVRLLSHAAVFFSHAMYAERSKREKKKQWWKKLVSFPVFFFLICLIPIYARIPAPLQVVPDHPHYVFAPFDGIIKKLHVSPGQPVKAGDLIFEYDTRVLEKQLDEARRAVAVALAELTRLEGAAYDDKDARARIPVQKLEVERMKAEVAYLEKQMDLSKVRTGADGVVLLDDPDALIGATVHTGQMVLRVADPKRTKLKLMVPVTDAAIFKVGDPAFVRLDKNPLESYRARVTRIGFDVEMSEKDIPSIVVEAEWEEAAPVTPGQRGRARIQGEKSTIGMVWFRRALTRWRDRFAQLGF